MLTQNFARQHSQRPGSPEPESRENINIHQLNSGEHNRTLLTMKDEVLRDTATQTDLSEKDISQESD